MDIEIYKKSLDNLSEYRRVHCYNVSKEAVRLAKKYGADVTKAEIAGLLHDVTKEKPNDLQLKIISDGGIILSDVEKCSPKLWHAISASIYIQKEFSIVDKDIINAVRYHTTARKNMSLLEKIVFLADFTSADRKYDDIDIIRKHADISLDDGVLYALKFTISKLSKMGALLSIDAVEAYNEILLNRNK